MNDSDEAIESKRQTAEISCEFVKLVWCDSAAVRRVRLLPRKGFIRSRGCGISVTTACMASGSHVDGPADGSTLSSTGEVRLVPDMATYRQIPRSPTALVVGSFFEKHSNERWPLCPRYILQRALEKLDQTLGLTMKAGFETEFVVLQKDGSPVDGVMYCQTRGLLFGMEELLIDMCRSLEAHGIEVEQMHSEGGQGQFEIVTQYGDAMQAADNLVITREVIESVASDHDLRVTFVPKLSLDSAGSGCHAHISLSKDNVNIFSDAGEKYGISATAQHFVAGILAHLPGLLALLAPSVNSYSRLIPSAWAGCYQCWGFENKDAALRMTRSIGSKAEVSNVEVKPMDAMSNPHMALAALLYAGLDGVEHQIVLGSPVHHDPAIDPHRSKLSGSLSEAVEALESDQVLCQGLGADVVAPYLAARKAEIAFFEGMDECEWGRWLAKKH